MITVEPTCRFCQRLMSPLVPFQSRGRTLYSYHCIRCKSEQLFAEDGQALEYSFRVGNYLCQFNSPTYKFQIVRQGPISNGGIPYTKVMLSLDFVPHNLRPDNTTEERIKTLILFS